MSETKFDKWLKLIREDPPAEFFQEHGRYLDRLVADSGRLEELRKFLLDQMSSAPYKTCCDGYEVACQDVLQELEEPHE